MRFAIWVSLWTIARTVQVIGFNLDDRSSSSVLAIASRIGVEGNLQVIKKPAHPFFAANSEYPPQTGRPHALKPSSSIFLDLHAVGVAPSGSDFHNWRSPRAAAAAACGDRGRGLRRTACGTRAGSRPRCVSPFWIAATTTCSSRFYIRWPPRGLSCVDSRTRTFGSARYTPSTWRLGASTHRLVGFATTTLSSPREASPTTSGSNRYVSTHLG